MIYLIQKSFSEDPLPTHRASQPVPQMWTGTNLGSLLCDFHGSFSCFQNPSTYLELLQKQEFRFLSSSHY